MGDEGHNRNRAGSAITLRELAPALVETGAPSSDVAAVLRFIGGNEHFFLNLGMPTAKLAIASIRKSMIGSGNRNSCDTSRIIESAEPSVKARTHVAANQSARWPRSSTICNMPSANAT